MQDGAGNGDALALPAREEHAALASQRVVALGQFADEFVRLRGAGGVFHVLLRRFGAAQADVARNGVGKEEGVLKDEGHLLHEGVAGDAAHVAAAHAHAALRCVPKARNEPRHGAFARAGGADQRRDAACRGGEADALQGGGGVLAFTTRVARIALACAVAEADVFKGHAGVLRLLARRGRLGQGRLAEHLLDAVNADARFADQVMQAHQRHDGLGHACANEQRSHPCGEIQPLPRQQPRAQPQQHGQRGQRGKNGY